MACKLFTKLFAGNAGAHSSILFLIPMVCGTARELGSLCGVPNPVNGSHDRIVISDLKSMGTLGS